MKPRLQMLVHLCNRIEALLANLARNAAVHALLDVKGLVGFVSVVSSVEFIKVDLLNTFIWQNYLNSRKLRQPILSWIT